MCASNLFTVFLQATSIYLRIKQNKSQFLSHRLRSDEFFPLCSAPVSLCTLRYNKSIDLLQRRVYRVRNQVCSLSPFTTVMKEQKSFRKFYWIRFWDLRNLWNDRNLVEWIFLKNYCILERYVWNMFECKECGFKIELVELFSSFFNLIQYN